MKNFSIVINSNEELIAYVQFNNDIHHENSLIEACAIIVYALDFYEKSLKTV